MRLLVTGGAGFIDSNFVRRIADGTYSGISSLNELLEIDKGHHDLLTQQRYVLALQLGAILDSTIWKATSPLRKFLTILKRKNKRDFSLKLIRSFRICFT